MTPAVITFAFDPLVHLGDVSIRLETLALAGIILAGLLVLARIARLTPAPGPATPAPTLRPSDVPFLILGIVPGAVLGGRLDYVLVHLDYYTAHPAATLDPGQGALGLGLAVPGAVLGGAIIARLVDAPVDRWLHAAVLPMLFVLAAGKLAGVLAADGQGAPSDAPWATAYLGDGPWSSLAAWLPSQPSQVYEAIGSTVVLIGLGLIIRSGAFSRRDGSVLFLGLALWGLTRGIAVSTWRDQPVVGPIRAEQLILICVVSSAFGAIQVVRSRRLRRQTL